MLSPRSAPNQTLPCLIFIRLYGRCRALSSLPFLQQVPSAAVRRIQPQLSGGRSLSTPYEEEGEDEASRAQDANQSTVDLRMENAVLRAEVAELHAREGLQRLEEAKGTTNAAPFSASCASPGHECQKKLLVARTPDPYPML